MKLKIEKFGRGFTIIELIVSIGLFITAVFMGLGMLVTLFDANSKSQTMFSAISKLNYAVDSMTRDIRFGTNYHCGTGTPYASPNSCTDGGTFLAVNSSSGATVIYRLNSGRIEKSSDGGANYKPATGSNVVIDYARFYVLGAEPGGAPPAQPRIVIIIKGHSGTKPSVQTNFDIETTVSQRSLDL